MTGFTRILAVLIVSAMGPFSIAAAADYTINCEAAIEYSDRHRGEAVMVIYQGNIICEDFNRGDRHSAHEIASGVKSLTAAMAAAAVHEGLLDLDERVSDTITEWQDDERLSQVTVRQLMSMTAGLQTRGGELLSYSRSIRARAIADPGTQFDYGPRAYAVFGELMTRKLDAAGIDLNPANYLRARVLVPLNADVERWAGEGGDFVLSESASINPLNWARFGMLIENGGEVQGTRLLDADAVAAMFEPTDAFPLYGMGWWVHMQGTDPALYEAQDMSAFPVEFPSVYAAWGAGSQYLFIIPEFDMVVVRMTRGVAADPRSRNTNFSASGFLTMLLQSSDQDTATDE